MPSGVSLVATDVFHVPSGVCIVSGTVFRVHGAVFRVPGEYEPYACA